jgi:hypothetical protein
MRGLMEESHNIITRADGLWRVRVIRRSFWQDSFALPVHIQQSMMRR